MGRGAVAAAVLLAVADRQHHEGVLQLAVISGDAQTVPEGAASAMISNDRYEITVTGNTLTVKAKKSYGDLPAGQAYDDDFYIKVKNLTVHFKLTQVDRSPDDWGNGGTQEDEL